MNDHTDTTRRDLLKAGMAGTALASLGAAGCSRSQPVAEGLQRETAPPPDWILPLARSVEGPAAYTPEVEGTLPADLAGTLYRNGPGRFDRGQRRKKHLLDGDGFVQRLHFAEGRVHFRAAFVQTPKFEREEAADRFLYSTWTTPRPGGPLRNLGGGPMQSQAGITVYPVGDRVYALDEGNPAWSLDPDTLATLGSHQLGEGNIGIKAHSKLDPVSGEWLLAGQDFGRVSSLNTVIHDQAGDLLHQHRVSDQPLRYFHDFLATEHYYVFVLHPCVLNPFGFLFGMRSVVDSLEWQPELGNRVVVVPRSGGEPRNFEATGAFMWHALNAHERGDEIVADIVAYDHPDHFIPINGREPLLSALMEGRMGAAEEPGRIRRYVINLRTGQLREEILHNGNHEFPFVDPRTATLRHRVGYFAWSGIGTMNTGIKRMDMDSGAEQVFDFGPGTHVGEPVFAADSSDQTDAGWLLAQCLDGASGRAFYAVFDARQVAAGPLARIWLQDALPISFHGWWQPLA
ncbi:carotenoid oxygenase [Natronospirillum operosum]|uniref:Carotenoid oxygenase n=1 Tax=Natronospirillum operosum TaxID=2759953 RepID=A0A4Z0WAU2_9GAMM|nr:carotenoid oxygenase family protein [Natronospirillum operosum]TGG90607.1 carotenoid oxygenase [Natronospirillum operosum]